MEKYLFTHFIIYAQRVTFTVPYTFNPMKDTDTTIQVLLTDDDIDDLMLFEEAIKEVSLPIEFSSAESGNELLRLLKGNYHPNLIFLDLNMPGKNGKDCLKELRSNPDSKNIPVIMYSTSSNKEDIETCYRRGANLYVIKPHLFSDIVKTLKQILSIDWNQSSKRSKDDFVLQA